RRPATPCAAAAPRRPTPPARRGTRSLALLLSGLLPVQQGSDNLDREVHATPQIDLSRVQFPDPILLRIEQRHPQPFGLAAQGDRELLQGHHSPESLLQYLYRGSHFLYQNSVD